MITQISLQSLRVLVCLARIEGIVPLSWVRKFFLLLNHTHKKSGWTRYLYRIKKVTALMHHSWDNKEGSHKGKFQFDVKDFRAFYSTIRSVRCKTKTNHDFVTCVQLSRAHRLRTSASSSHWFVVLLSLAFIGHCNWFVLVWKKRHNKASSYWLFHC